MGLVTKKFHQARIGAFLERVRGSFGPHAKVLVSEAVPDASRQSVRFSLFSLLMLLAGGVFLFVSVGVHTNFRSEMNDAKIAFEKADEKYGPRHTAFNLAFEYSTDYTKQADRLHRTSSRLTRLYKGYVEISEELFVAFEEGDKKKFDKLVNKSKGVVREVNRRVREVNETIPRLVTARNELARVLRMGTGTIAGRPQPNITGVLYGFSQKLRSEDEKYRERRRARVEAQQRKEEEKEKEKEETEVKRGNAVREDVPPALFLLLPSVLSFFGRGRRGSESVFPRQSVFLPSLLSSEQAGEREARTADFQRKPVA